MRLGDSARDREAKPGPARRRLLTANARGVEPHEPLEDALLRLDRNSLPFIDDIDLVVSVATGHSHLDRSAGGRMFDRVIEEIEQQPTKQVRVALERSFDCLTQLDSNRPRISERPHGTR